MSENIEKIKNLMFQGKAGICFYFPNHWTYPMSCDLVKQYDLRLPGQLAAKSLDPSMSCQAEAVQLTLLCSFHMRQLL